MALDMIEIMNVEQEKLNIENLKMRIGIHTGNIIGGVIGTDIVRYDIFGKDVIIAEKLESKSDAGKI